jgi:hypothetical protein
MSPVPGSGERWAAAALDHFAAACGYHPVPEARPRSGGWRRLYLSRQGEPVLSVVGPEDGGWASLGVEVEAPRHAVRDRLAALLEAVAPFEVALDADAGPDADAPVAVVRVALRLFVEGLTPAVFRDAVANVSAAAAELRRALGLPSE